MIAARDPVNPAQAAEVVIIEGAVGIHALKMIAMFFGSAACVAGGVAIAMYKDWRWGAGITALFGFGVVISLVQLLRTGRYQLTTQRLVWRPFFGRGSRQALLSSLDLTSLEVDADSGLIKVGVPGGKKIAMGCVARFQEFWGALVLWHELAAVAVDTNGAPLSGAVATWPCNRIVRGALPVQGTAVARPGYLAFVPDAFVERRSTAQLAAQVVTGLALAMVGAGIRRTAARPPTHKTLALAATASAEYFDEIVARMAQLLGGDVFPSAAPAITPGPKTTQVTLAASDGYLVANLHPPLAAWVTHVTTAWSAPALRRE